MQIYGILSESSTQADPWCKSVVNRYTTRQIHPEVASVQLHCLLCNGIVPDTMFNHRRKDKHDLPRTTVNRPSQPAWSECVQRTLHLPHHSVRSTRHTSQNLQNLLPSSFSTSFSLCSITSLPHKLHVQVLFVSKHVCRNSKNTSEHALQEV